MSEKFLFSSAVVWDQLGTVKQNISEVVLLQDRRKPPLQQLFVVAKAQ